MNSIDIARQTLTRHEGIKKNSKGRHILYPCTSGKLTIGIGRNIQDRGISDDEADYLFRNDIRDCERDLDREYPWWRQLDTARRAVMIELMFNLGADRLRQFSHPGGTLEALEDGQFELAAERLSKSLWARQVKTRAATLIEMLRTGKLPDWVREVRLK